MGASGIPPAVPHEVPIGRGTACSARLAALGLLLLLGAAARLDGLTFGFPAYFHPDETVAANTVTYCERGRPVEHRYLHPPLLADLACGLYRLAGPVLPKDGQLRPRSVFFLRCVSAAAGSAAVLFTYLLATELLSPAAALGAALLFAVFPAAVATSKYGTPDSLLTTFVVAALWLQVRLASQPGAKAYFAAATATALAVAAKYNGAFLALSFVVAHAIASAGDRRAFFRAFFGGRALLPSVAGVALALAIGFPGVLFGGDAARFVQGVLGEREHLVQAGHYGFTIGPETETMRFHFVHSILPASGPLLLAAIVAGLALLGWKAAKRSRAGAVVMAFALPYYVAIEMLYKVPPSYERYVLPLLPVYLVAAMLPADRAAAGWSKSARVAALASWVLLLVAVPAWRSAALLAAIHDDTRSRMGAWMQLHLRDGRGEREEPAAVSVQWPSFVPYYPPPKHGHPLQSLRRGREGLPSTEYFLASSLLYERYFDFPLEEPGWTRFYEKVFAKGTLVHEEDAGAGRYMFHNPTLRLYRFVGRTDGAAIAVPVPLARRPDPAPD